MRFPRDSRSDIKPEEGGLWSFVYTLETRDNGVTTAWRVLTAPTEHTCKGLGPVDAHTPRYTYDFFWIFPNLAVIAIISTPEH